MYATPHNSIEKSVAIVGFFALALIASIEVLALSQCYGGVERPYREPTHSIMNAIFLQTR
jgi:hypothetical protein